jgi:outer membrane biosynthesis protein TonB
VIDYGEISTFSAMVKVGILLLGLSWFVLPAKAIELSNSPTPDTQQENAQQSGQQHKGATSGGWHFRVCEDNNPVNCHAVDGVAAPKVLHAPDPKLTDSARKNKLDGISVVGVIVGTDGKPYNVHLVRSMSEGLDQTLQPAALEQDQKAIEAVQRYKFRPATYQGRPVPVEVTIEVRIYPR